eukprot:TRINITY_DN4323_c0_g1_i1.p1 TRINITY_DN4323_c0_g1~~TRINITY_DN4323_c0_g1_i1.p1  ORF type:complete len:391 (-),score=71.92 TRINITY_DN4323_c0_g1_i1:81-1253(-)
MMYKRGDPKALLRERVRPHPNVCPMCNTGIIKSIPEAIDHIRSQGHIRHCSPMCICKGKKCGATTLLDCPAQNAAHVMAGFDLEELGLQAKRQRRSDGTFLGAAELDADPDWLSEEQRWFAEWNYDDRGVQTTSQQIADCTRRLRVGQKAPTFTVPAPLPKSLTAPSTSRSQVPLKWPYHPPLKFLMQTFLKNVGEKNDTFDVALSTAALYALSGHAGFLKETFVVEKCGKCVVVEHKPAASHDDLTTPLAKVKANCTKMPDRKHYMSFGKVTVGNFRLLLVSEVAASGPDGKPLEVLTGTAPRLPPEQKQMFGLRMLSKGTSAIKYVQVTDNKITLTHDDRLPANYKSSEAHVTAGKVARHNIAVMLDSVTVDNKAMKMTFVKGRPVVA